MQELQDSQLQPSGSEIEIPTANTKEVARKKRKQIPQMPIGNEYGRHSPGMSKRLQNQKRSKIIALRLG